jgi:hypothetical protein
MAIKKGTEFILYYSATALTNTQDATITGASWTEAENVASANPTSSREDNTVTIRKDGGTEVGLGGKITNEINFSVPYDPDDGFYDALATAYDADNEIALADMDGAIATTGSKGLVGNFNIKEFSRDEPDSGAAVVTVRARPTSTFLRNWEVPA